MAKENQWEYLTLMVRDQRVISINDDAPMHYFGGMEDNPAYIYRLHDFLALMGKEGWEAVGISPVSGNGEVPGFVDVIILLKRSL